MKKIFAVILVIAMTMGLVTTSWALESAYKVPGGTIYFNAETGAITGYEAEDYGAELVIPSEINGVKVTSIGNLAFYLC